MEIISWEQKRLNLSVLFISKMDGLSPSRFHGVHKKNMPFVEDLLLLNFPLSNFDILWGKLIGEFAL